MKVKKITKREDYWVNLKTPVLINTVNGPKECSRVYINGIREVFLIKFSDGTSLKATGNHRLMSKQGEWVTVDDLTEGFIFNNELKVVKKEPNGKEFVLDMEVQNEHHYILENGVISHNSSFILGQVSQSIEPFVSNYFTKDLAKGVFTYRNPFLEKILESKKYNKPEIWKSILRNGGSVQKLDCLEENEKALFKSFGEISQKEVVIQAAQRQPYIDQGQSLNVMVPPNIPAKEASNLMILGWKMGVKSFYYQRSANPVHQLKESIMGCASCEA